jgi:hypothetical protein
MKPLERWARLCRSGRCRRFCHSGRPIEIIARVERWLPQPRELWPRRAEAAAAELFADRSVRAVGTAYTGGRPPHGLVPPRGVLPADPPLEDALALTRAGFTGPDALHIYRAPFGFLHGHVLNELQSSSITRPRQTTCSASACTACRLANSAPARPRSRPCRLRRSRRTRTRP